MPTRTARAIWEGTLKEGKGNMHYSGFDGPFTFVSRFEEGEGTNPETLIGAAHAGCYSMAFSLLLGNAGFPPKKIETMAKVTLGEIDGAPRITKIHLQTEAEVPGISAEEFQKIATETKTFCPVSAALAAVPEITLDAKLL